MFGWCSSLGLPSVSSEPEKERRPPPAPTPLDFPVYRLPELSDKDQDASLSRLNEVLASIRRPQDINPQKFEALNLRLQENVSAAEIVRHNGPKTDPPLPWENMSARSSPVDEDGCPILMDNGNSYPSRDRFEMLQTELLLDNDDAFREVGRLPPREGRERVRVAQTRKFWTGLERMAQYWDSSLDDYYERPKTPEQAGPEKMQIDGETQRAEGQDQTETTMDVDPAPPAQALEDGPSAQLDATPEMVAMYKGRRIGAGNEMPEDVREETIRALTEMAAWPFGCQAAPPISPPRLAVKNLLFPVRHTFQTARSPKDRQLARSGVMEGPVFVAQCRPETSFRGPQEAPGSGMGEVCDLLREVGAMLLTAQERARQGEVEVRPGEGKWWTTVPRWGGALNDSVSDYEKETHGEDKLSSMSGYARKRSKYEHPFLASRRPSVTRKLSNSERWKIIQPGPGLWDRRMRYIQIGKPLDSAYDDIYLLSSINHHVSILHLRVHRRYLEVITNGSSNFPPVTDTPDQPWYVLQLRRTRWYDLFDGEDRVEVLKGIWRIFHYLLRQQPETQFLN
ncbi:hypothetical protein ASPCADRAFT_210238 [Aspergillus carbonarius ITEM 5010]|uniref:Uncharacterized protein n=1 Tax=Aspergillus carbonarius (strain ITEM 5010) TaxID=602072 RepID=A0A1R3RD18_ASPC5|nr:hypothetical protein ASPCADRAFT_210238 [Aspergillus carbonarius ITEM 5010]